MVTLGWWANFFNQNANSILVTGCPVPWVRALFQEVVFFPVRFRLMRMKRHNCGIRVTRLVGIQINSFLFVAKCLENPQTRTQRSPSVGTDPCKCPGARFSKVPVISGPVNLSGNLPGNFTGPDNVFLEAPVNFPANFRAR